MVSRRQERVAEVLREELSIIVATELTDPRLDDALLNVTDVQVSPDLRSARVFVEHALPADQAPRVLQALRHAEGFLRRGLAENLKLRYVPELTFQIDSTSVRAQRVDALLDQVARDLAAPPTQDAEPRAAD